MQSSARALATCLGKDVVTHFLFPKLTDEEMEQAKKNAIKTGVTIPLEPLHIECLNWDFGQPDGRH